MKYILILLLRTKIGKAGMEKETRHKGRSMLKSPHKRVNFGSDKSYEQISLQVLAE